MDSSFNNQLPYCVPNLYGIINSLSSQVAFYENAAQEVISHTENLQQLLQTTTELSTEFDGVLKSLRRIAPLPMKLKNLLFNEQKEEQLLRLFRKAFTDHSYDLSIETCSSFPNPVYKEKGFSLEFTLKDRSKNEFYLPGTANYRIFLLTSEKNPEVVCSNISGNKVLRGTVISKQEKLGIIRFPNIVVNEVSSHYPSEGFYFVVANLEDEDIKPFIKSNFKVKARRSFQKFKNK